MSSQAEQGLLQQAPQALAHGNSLWSDAWYRLKQNKLALAGLVFLSLSAALCVLAPWIAPYGYEQQDLQLGATPPSVAHWLGTDTFGRDLLTRILYGGRISLAVGFIATAVALVIGVLWGAVAAYAGGRVDSVMMRIVDILYALPFIIFIILLMVVFGKSILLLFLAIGAVEWLTMARIVRGQTLSLKSREFVIAARASGVSSFNIIRRHIIPNLLGPVIVYVTLVVPQVILVESFLSFLGLGVQEPNTSLGVLISEGAKRLEDAPHTLLFPAVILAIILFSLNFIGDGLRDALDPKDR